MRESRKKKQETRTVSGKNKNKNNNKNYGQESMERTKSQNILRRSLYSVFISFIREKKTNCLVVVQHFESCCITYE